MLSSFEEDHCWKQGTRTDPTGVKSVKATKDDAERLKKYGVTPGQEIGIAFRVHMLCHQTFSVYDAVTKSYFSH